MENKRCKLHISEKKRTYRRGSITYFMKYPGHEE
jgi:hypothetical protein